MINFDPATGKMRIRVTQENVSEALKIKELMNHPGWEVFTQEIAFIRERITRNIEEDSLDVAKKELVQIRGAMLNLIRQIMDACPKIVESTKRFLGDEKEKLTNG